MNYGKGFEKFAKRFETLVDGRYPNMKANLESINIGVDKHISPILQKSGVFATQDSKVRSYVASPQLPPLVRIDAPNEVKDFIAKAEAAKVTKDSISSKLDTFMYFDKAAGQYVLVPTIKGTKTADSLIPGMAISPWNVGYMNRVIKQPYTPSFASHLVSVEGFSNPWADVVAVFKAAFEGYGQISRVAKGTIEQNASSPVTSEYGMIASPVFNLSVDYESSIEEQARAAGQPGNFLSPMANGDRERYAKMMLERLRDSLIIFGASEVGFDGLINVATGGVVNYTGTPLNDIVNGASTTKGSDITKAIVGLISEFLRENAYMPKEVKISCSTYVMKALTSTVYSDQYNPDSPMQTIKGRFDVKNDVGGGLQSIGWTIVADPMLDPNTPFNPNAYDLFIITVPSVRSALEDQQGLVILPEPLSEFIVPPLYQRGGLLYTMYKRIGSIIAPVENTVRVWGGFGYQ